MIRLILCGLLHLHRPHAGVNLSWSFSWSCARCGSIQRGRFGGRHVR